MLAEHFTTKLVLAVLVETEQVAAVPFTPTLTPMKEFTKTEAASAVIVNSLVPPFGFQPLLPSAILPLTIFANSVPPPTSKVPSAVNFVVLTYPVASM